MLKIIQIGYVFFRIIFKTRIHPCSFSLHIYDIENIWITNLSITCADGIVLQNGKNYN